MIPRQLQDEKYGFCLVLRNKKKAFEDKWPERPRKYGDSHLIKWITKWNGNYGVMGGFGGLLILDYDDLQLAGKIRTLLPKTMSVLTGSGKIHDYYHTDDTTTKHYSGLDIQGTGAMVVGAGSIHPNGNQYQLLNDLPIAFISRKELNSIIAPFFPSKQTTNSQFQNIVFDKSKIDAYAQKLIDWCLSNKIIAEGRYRILFRNIGCALQEQPEEVVRNIAEGIVNNCPINKDGKERSPEEIVYWYQWAKQKNKTFNPLEVQKWIREQW